MFVYRASHNALPCLRVCICGPHASCVDVQAEKEHQGFMHGITDFDKCGLKTTETQEKNLIPDKESM